MLVTFVIIITIIIIIIKFLDKLRKSLANFFLQIFDKTCKLEMFSQIRNSKLATYWTTYLV